VASSYRLKSNSDSVHPYLTPLQITQASEFKSHTLTKAECCEFRFFARFEDRAQDEPDDWEAKLKHTKEMISSDSGKVGEYEMVLR